MPVVRGGMIDLYTWRTPNGRKISLMLEETGLAYRVLPIDIGKGEQLAPAYLELNPNGKIPTIVDHEGPDGQPLVLFESGAILLYLAQKSGRFMPADTQGYWRAVQWLQFQAANVGPMLGQAQHFLHYAQERFEYPVQRYSREAQRLYRVLDKRLSMSRYLADDTYTIADVATWPWLRAWKIQGIDLNEHPHIARWLAEIEARPAVQREREILADRMRAGPLDAQARAALFAAQSDTSTVR
jgi:GSH-dependent disulfide-bond oxidoreductase